MLQGLKSQSQCRYVFTILQDGAKPLSANTLADQHRDVMKTCNFHPDAGLHALKHTFLTEAERYRKNVRALMKLAGHERITTTMRYVHPDVADVVDTDNLGTSGTSKTDWGGYNFGYSRDSRDKRSS